MGRLEGMVALVTGAARGQGRSHAVRLAEEGADVIGLDICAQIETVPYPMATSEQLDETGRLVEELDRRALMLRVDVRDRAGLADAVGRGIAEFGHIDAACINAGIFSFATIAEMSDEQWDDLIATNLTGVFNTMRAIVPHMIERQRGRIVATSSMAGRGGFPNIGHYVASKWGVIGLVKSLAMEVGRHNITVNAVCPTSVDTDMIQNEAAYRLFMPGVEHPTREQAQAAFGALNVLPIPWIEPRDVSNAIVWLCSDEARYISGAAIPVAAGQNASGSD